jgi:hypothetical protein
MPVNLLLLFRAIQNTPLGATVRNSPVLFPCVMTVHLVGLAMLVGTILAMDIGLLGIGMRRQPVSEIASQLQGWAATGAALVLASGAVLFTARAVRCYRNPYFHLKMILLIVAAIYHLTLHRRVIRDAARIAPGRRKLAGSVSLLLWIGAGFAGQVFTAF